MFGTCSFLIEVKKKKLFFNSSWDKISHISLLMNSSSAGLFNIKPFVVFLMIVLLKISAHLIIFIHCNLISAVISSFDQTFSKQICINPKE